MRCKTVLLGLVASCLSLGAFAAGIDYYSIGCDCDKADAGHKGTVYFNQNTYVVGRFYSSYWWSLAGYHGDYIDCFRLSTDASTGRLGSFTRGGWVATPSTDSGLSGNDVTAVVYNGKVYAFYDYINPANNNERFLYYKSTSDPDAGWSPNGGNRISVATTLTPGYGSMSTPNMTIAAAVLNGKLYVFYTDRSNDNLHSVVYNGADWVAGPNFCTSGSVLGRVNAIAAQVVLTDTHKEVIAIFCGGSSSSGVATFDGTLYYAPTSTLAVSNPDTVQAAYGTLFNGALSNTLQVFYDNDLDFAEVTLPGDTGNTGTITSHTGLNFKGSAIIHYASDSSGNLQQYISALSYSYLGSSMSIVTCVSDYYKFISSHEINTTESGVLPSSWSLIGVIEGVPPFALNNNAPGSAGESSVTYGESTESSVSTTTTYGLSVSAGVSGKIDSVGGAGLTVSGGYKNVRDYDQAITKSVEFTWKNSGDNAEGAKGFLVIQKPTMAVDNYTRYAYDQSVELGLVNFTSVKSVDIEYDTYDLNSPLAGMKAQPISSNYKGWYLKSPGTTNCLERINSLSAVHGVGSTTSSIKLTSTSSVENDYDCSVKVEGDLLSIFKASGDFSFNLDSKSSTTLGQNISATLTLADPPSGETRLVDKISVIPYWMAAKDISQAYWIPSGYSGSTPWCLTWSVASLTPVPVGTTSANLDFNGDGVQDVLSYVPTASGAKTLSSGVVHLVSGVKSNYKSFQDNGFPIPDATSYSLVGSGKFDANGQSSLVWFDADDGALSISLSEDSKLGEAIPLSGAILSSADQFATCGDFIPGDSCDEILLRNASTGLLVVCGVGIVNHKISSYDAIFIPNDANWSYQAKGDFDGNGCADVLICDSATKEFRIIYLKERGSDGSIVKATTTVFSTLTAGKKSYTGDQLTVLGSGDFDGNDVSDVLFSEAAKGKILVALMSADGLNASGYVKGFNKLSKNQSVSGVGDFNADGCADLLLAVSSNGKRSPKLTIKFLGSKGGSATAPIKAFRSKRLSLGADYEKAHGSELLKSLD